MMKKKKKLLVFNFQWQIYANDDNDDFNRMNEKSSSSNSDTGINLQCTEHENVWKKNYPFIQNHTTVSNGKKYSGKNDKEIFFFFFII